MLSRVDQEITEELKGINESMSKRLDSLEHTVSQQGQFPVGSFLNPANNCSHILHQHPLATSGEAIPCLSYMNFKFCVHRLLLAAELCSKGVL